MKKRFLSMVLLLAMLLTLLPLQAFGLERQETTPWPEDAVWEEFSTQEEALEAVRLRVRQCREHILVKYPVRTPDCPETYEEFWDLVMAHTGDPREGDSLQNIFLAPHILYYDPEPMEDGENTLLSVYIFMEYTPLASPERDKELDLLVAQALEEMGCRDASDYEKVLAVYEYVCSHVKYSYNGGADAWTAYHALKYGTAVCSGYAQLFYRLCMEMNVDCRMITSITVTTGPRADKHDFNIVKLGDRYYYCDTTWDAGNGPEEFEHFLRGSKNFETVDFHRACKKFRTPEFQAAYPVSVSDYGYVPGEISEDLKDITVERDRDCRFEFSMTGFTGGDTEWFRKAPGESSFTSLGSWERDPMVLRLEEVTLAQDGTEFYAVYTDYMGHSVKTRTAVLHVEDYCRPTILTQPEADLYAPEGEFIDLIADAESGHGGVQYQWFLKKKDAAEYQLISDFFRTSVQMTPEMDGASVYCRVTDGLGLWTDTRISTLHLKKHTPGEPVMENVVPPTCSQAGSCDEVVYCTVCGKELSRELKFLPKLPHTPGRAVRENVVPATCAAEGSYEEVVYCSVCGEEISRTRRVIEKLPHTPGTPVRENEVPPTKTEEGSYDEVVYCTVCGEELSRKTVIVPRLGPDVFPFEDVPETEWYYPYVVYVFSNGLMNGHTPVIFGPEENLTRAQLAQILYNKEGTPAVTAKNTFTDVKDSDWFRKPVTWAAEKKYVGGYGGGLFGPEDPITREQLATILWRYAGKPETSGSLDIFKDKDQADGWAEPALKWAVEKKIVGGKGDGILDPQGNATRAEVAKMIRCYIENVENPGKTE